MIKDTLKQLCLTYGATGREAGIAALIKETIAPYCDEISEDALGNVIAIKRGKASGKRVMLAAHMDHIAFVVIDIDEHGFLRVQNVGGVRKNASINRAVVFENGVRGVVSCEVRENDPADATMLKLFIDIGAKDRQDAERMVRRGDCAIYAPEFNELANGICSAPAMDNRAGCALLIETLRSLENAENTLIAAFTTQEEVGLRGAKAAAYGIEPDIGLALDVTLAGDVPKGPRIAVNVGDGIAVKIMDSSLVCHPQVVEALEAAAERAGAKYQREVLVGGGTDAAAIQLTRAGIPAGGVSVPCRYVHSAAETVSIGDMEEGVKLLCAFLRDTL